VGEIAQYHFIAPAAVAQNAHQVPMVPHATNRPACFPSRSAAIF